MSIQDPEANQADFQAPLENKSAPIVRRRPVGDRQQEATKTSLCLIGNYLAVAPLLPQLLNQSDYLISQAFEFLSENAQNELETKRSQGNLPDFILVLMDYPAPKASPEHFDLEALIALKTLLGSNNTPILVMGSQNLPVEIQEKAFQVGITDFIQCSQDIHKDFKQLLPRIQRALEQKREGEKSTQLMHQLNQDLKELYDRNIQVEKELYVTRQLQQSLLPKVIPSEKKSSPSDTGLPELARLHYKDQKIQISGIYIPCDSLGGDLYDINKFKNDTIGITVADVSGHGVPAAFVTAIYKAVFYRMTNTYEGAGEILYHLNNELNNIVKTGEYVTCIYCRVKDEGKSFEYSGAGHPYPVHYVHAENKINRLTENGTPLIWFRDMEYPTTQVPLGPGDKILLFTDGISEMKSPDKELYGEERLEALFLKLIHESPDTILDKIMEEMSEYCQGEALEDDMSMVLIEVLDEPTE
jgi:phosphoserine phosphatase RsbU/P